MNHSIIAENNLLKVFQLTLILSGQALRKSSYEFAGRPVKLVTEEANNFDELFIWCYSTMLRFCLGQNRLQRALRLRIRGQYVIILFKICGFGRELGNR
jgi:hypothetical protein